MTEVEQLRARVAELERLVAQSQERTYWLDRLGLDLDKVMANPAVWFAYRTAGRSRQLLRAVRGRVR